MAAPYWPLWSSFGRVAAELAIPGQDDNTGALVAAWLATKRSPHTRAAHLRDLAQWAGWLAGHGVRLLEADETAAAMWARHLEAAGTRNTTAARKLTAVSSSTPGAYAAATSGPTRWPACPGRPWTTTPRPPRA
jgi:hypothetical protein